MFFVFNKYWMPVFGTYRDHKVVKAWSNLMPEMFKEKYREQILSAWLKVAQDKDLAWV